MNVRLDQFVTQMQHVQIHLDRLNVRVIKVLLVMDLYVMVRYTSYSFLPLWLTFVIINQKIESNLFYQ